MNKIHEWINTALIVFVAILVLVGGNQSDQFGSSGTRFPNGVSVDSTSPSAGEVRGTTLTFNGVSSLTGTSTISKSYDGFIAWDDFTVATGSAKAIITNSSGTAWMCQSGMVYADGTTYAPSLVIAVGTSTATTGGNQGLLASTTLATTTDTVLSTDADTGDAGSSFIVLNGVSITGSLSDYTNAEASSTNLTNWNIQMAFPCWVMGQ